MPQFTYVGDDGRYYPDLGVTANAGDVVEFDEAPADGRWTPTNAKATATASTDTTTTGGK